MQTLLLTTARFLLSVVLPFDRVFPDATLPGVTLRILPLGDSITWGYKSTTGNGYRQDLLDLLPNHTVNYVGTQRSGNMTDPNNEGHPGAVISQILGFCDGGLQPNVILLMAGTNDMGGNLKVSEAPSRLSKLIDALVIYYPESAVIVAELTPIADKTIEANVEVFNAAIPGIVAQKQALGEKVLAVDMSAQVSADDLEDGVHPNDRGYQLMANVWLDGLNEAAVRHWISQPLGAMVQ